MENFGMNEMSELEDLKKMLDDLNSQFGTEPSREDEISQIIKEFDFVKTDFSITTRYTNISNNPDPIYSKSNDSGFDLRAYLDAPITLKSLERTLIPTGLSFELSPKTELQVRPRSGMALKHGITVLNTPGTVDEGYRGEVGVIIINLSNEDYTIQPGDRIAQGVVTNVVGESISKLSKIEKLNETERGSGGFGSTGKE